MFDLNRDFVRIADVNPRAEKHGDDDVLACDIKCEASMPNAVLSKFSESLKSCLYTHAEGATGDMLNPDHMPVLRNPLMGPIKWALEMESTQFRVHHSDNEGGDIDDLVFSDCKTSKFTLTCKEGGTVVVGFRVQCHPDEADAARLLTMINKTVKVSLIDETGVGVGEDEQPSESSSQEGGLFVAGDEGHTGTEAEDELYEDAAAYVVAAQRASVSALQKEFHIGYNRAAALLESLERNGVVSEQNESGKREVLHQPAALVEPGAVTHAMSVD